MENELKEMLKRGALAIGAQGKIKWGESESLYCNFF